MKKYRRDIGLIILVIIALPLVSCQKKQGIYEKIEPAHLEHLEDSELSKLTLTQRAFERTGVQTSPVEEALIAEGDTDPRKRIPYAAVLYDAYGHAWVYTNPEPLVFIRHEIKIDFIEKDKAVLHEGPPLGTLVVTVGASELYGTEYEVGH